MDTFHPDIQRAMESENQLPPMSHKMRLFANSIRLVRAHASNELIDEVERDLCHKERIGEITLQERLALFAILHGRDGMGS